MPRETLLNRTFVELADTLVADFDVVELLTLLADRCVDVLGVAAAGLMLVAPDGDLRVMASSSEAMRIWSCSNCNPRKAPVSTASAPGDPSPTRTCSRRWPLAPIRGRSARRRVPLSTRVTPETARHCHRRPEPVLHPAGHDAPSRPRRGPGPRRCRHHRHSSAPRRPPGPGTQRATQPGAQQPDRHRAGERDSRRAGTPQHGTGVLQTAQSCRETRTSSWQTSPTMSSPETACLRSRSASAPKTDVSGPKAHRATGRTRSAGSTVPVGAPYQCCCRGGRPGPLRWFVLGRWPLAMEGGSGSGSGCGGRRCPCL